MLLGCSYHSIIEAVAVGLKEQNQIIGDKWALGEDVIHLFSINNN